MANPVAAHTFDFVRVYLSTRTGGAPGSGAWTNPVKIFDGSGTPSKSTCQTFSAGALGPTDPNNGIIGQCTDDTAGGQQRLTWLGNGIPDTARTIIFAGSVGQILGDDYWDTSQGAWTFGGARYIALSNGTQVVVIKSIDDFATPAAIMDGAHGPPSSIDGYKAAIQRINNKIYVFTTSNDDGDKFALWKFNLASDRWEGPFAALTGASIHRFGTSVDGFTNGLFEFPNGDLLILFEDFTPRASVQLWVAATGLWNPPQFLPGTDYAQAVLDPSQGTIHIFTYDTFTTDGVVYYSTFDHAGSIITPSIDTIPAPVGGSFDGVGHSSIQNGMLFVPRDDRADLDNAVWVAAIPVTAPFQKELLPIPAGESGKEPSCAYMIFPNGYAFALALACPLTPTAQLGVAYDDFLIRTGGTAPFTFTILSGALPPGLLLNAATGEISGIPTAAGVFNYVARVTDANGLTADTPGCPLTIAAGPLALLCPVLQSGTVGNPFIGQLLASGGTPPYTFSIIAGSLPPGFTLDPATGIITGIAAIVGSYSFTARVTDSLAATADSSACPITITICISAQSQLPMDPPPIFGGDAACLDGDPSMRSQLP